MNPLLPTLSSKLPLEKMTQKKEVVPPPGPSNAHFPIGLAPQTGMPQIYASRSKELLYDTLMAEPLFMLNPFGPQLLAISRPNHRW